MVDMLGRQKGRKELSRRKSYEYFVCTIVGDLFIMWQEEVIFKQIGEGGEGCNYRMIM